MTQDAKNSRFRVYKFEGVILVNGAINDTTKYSALDEMVSESQIHVDCQNLESASWLGLTNFCKYFANQGKQVSFSNIPASIYKYFKLIPDLSDKFIIKSMGIELVPDPRPLSLMLDEKLLVDMSKKQGQFVRLDKGWVFGFVANSCRELKLDKATLQNDFKHPWCKKNAEETEFFFSYMFFVAASVGLAADIVRSVGLSLVQLLSNIVTRMDNAYEGVKVVVPNLKSDKVNALRSLLEKAHESCNREAKNIEDVLSRLEVCIGQYQLISLNNAGSKKEELYSSIEEVKNSLSNCVALSQVMEDIGADIGQGILSLTSFDELKNIIMKIGAESISSEQLEKIRDKFNIMDPMSADSWEDTRAEIIGELDHIDSDISRCTVVLQGFDLTRQVLEHRIAESQKLEEMLPNLGANKIAWHEIKSTLSTMIADKLVTEQEKAAYAFYLPEGFEAYKTTTSRKNPGDVLLF